MAAPLSVPASTARLGELVPRAGLRQLEALLEEYKRRGYSPRELWIGLEMNEDKGTVRAVIVPRRFGWE